MSWKKIHTVAHVGGHQDGQGTPARVNGEQKVEDEQREPLIQAQGERVNTMLKIQKQSAE